MIMFGGEHRKEGKQDMENSIHMNQYDFTAVCYNGRFNRTLFNQLAPIAENMFNNLPRKNKKKLKVTVDPIKDQLKFSLQSSITLTPENYLRSCQYFSKAMCTLPGMRPYISGTHLLVQN